MMTFAEISAALSTPPAIPWQGEPLLGSCYGEEEIAAAVGAMRDAMPYDVGFGFSAAPIPEFEAAFARYVHAADAVALNSCGPAIDLIMRYLKLSPDDEVIIPACNFVAAAQAVIGAGGKVIWGDCDPETLQLDPADVERKISPRTRAIFPVHMNGGAAFLEEYGRIAASHPHPVYGPPKIIGDAARAAGAAYHGEKLGCGRHAWATVFSFHTMKNMTTLGEGGMLVSDDLELTRFARSARMYGGLAGTWGTSYVMTKVQAAVGLVQLRKLDHFIAARRRIAAQRDELLADVPGILLPRAVPDSVHSYYLYSCRVETRFAGAKRDALLAELENLYRIKCVVANPPTYLARPDVAAQAPVNRTPQGEMLGETLFCVPLHPAMPESDNRYICAAIIRAAEKILR